LGQASYGILTAHDNPPVLDKTINNFEGLRSSCPGLVESESVHALQDRFDLILSENVPYEFLCAALSESDESVKKRLT
jgi:hypothetical protein